MSNLPKTMKALRYEEPRKHSIVQVPLPVVRDGDILIKGLSSPVLFRRSQSASCVA